MLGIITIAQGDERYITMSKMLALSLLQTNPQIKRAVISDAPEHEFKGLYDIYIPYNKEFGKGLSQKLYLDTYSPFEETLFIDADCLAFNSLDTMIELCRKYSFVVFGDQINSGNWCMDVDEICKKFNVPSIPRFNGGTYYFKNAEVATNIFNKARELHKKYDELGIAKFRGSVNEEPLIAIAMAINKIEAVEDEGIGMRTPIGINGALKINIFDKKCGFVKQGISVEPAILHFAGSFADAFHYKREIAKLKIAYKFPSLNKKVISSTVNLICNTSYGAFIFSKRVLKIFIRREKFNFKDSLPVFSNQ